MLQGFLCCARSRWQLFTPHCIATIFGNVEQIYALSTQLLTDMEDSCRHSGNYDCQLGPCFLRRVRYVLSCLLWSLCSSIFHLTPLILSVKNDYFFGCFLFSSKETGVSSPERRTEMYAGRVGCCPLVSQFEYTSLLRWERPTDRQTPD